MQFGLYVHVPFCLKRCTYCDFFTMPLLKSRDDHFSPYLEALHKEFEEQAPRFPERKLASIFFGGGTPSLLEPEELAKILEQARSYFPWEEDIEITLEVNPETLSIEKAEGFLQAGVNRISMGVQSLDDKVLRLLNRTHNVEGARASYEIARKAGFENVSMDMIYALPGQEAATWKKELSELLSWVPEHLSLYELILEPGSPMTRAVKNGELTLPSEEESAQMYEIAREQTTHFGLDWYEISNYSKPGREARHNVDNWLGGEYLGIGPGAHSFWAKKPFGARRANPRNMPMYLENPAKAQWKERGRVEAIQEALMNGLRVRKGFSLAVANEAYGLDLMACLKDRLPPLQEADYLVVEEGHWSVTERGAELLDSVVSFLVAELDKESES